MNIFKNNIIAILIHMCCIPIFLIGVIVFVAASPLYQSRTVSFVIMAFLYFLAYVGYIALNMKYLKLSKSILHDYLSGIGVVIVSVVIWAVTYTTNFPVLELHDYDGVWIPYNLYNFLLWPILFRVDNYRIIMCIGLLNGAFAPITISLKRLQMRHISKIKEVENSNQHID